MSANLILTMAGTALMGAVCALVPRLSRPTLFFAVTVAREFRRTAEARGILRTFDLVVWTATLASLALTVAGLVADAVFVPVVAFLGALVYSHSRALRFAAKPDAVVEVDLRAPNEHMPGGPIFAVLPIAILIGLSVWAVTHWDRLPPRLPMHWGIHGVDRWADATPTTVAATLGLFLLVCLMLLAAAWGILHWSRRISTSGPAQKSEIRFRHRVVTLLVVAEYLVIFPAFFTILGLPRAMPFWIAAISIATLGIVTVLFLTGQGGSRIAPATGLPLGDRTPDSCWKLGLFYVNRNDHALIVEQRIGVGYTVNFGNPRAWIALALVLCPMVIALVFLR